MSGRWRFICCGWLQIGLLVSAGCGTSTPINSAIQRVDETLKPADIETFLALAAELPHSTFTDASTPFAPPPKWDSERTLPVRELINGELLTLDERLQGPQFLDRVPNSKSFQRTLKRQHISRQRFASLALAIGMALSKSSIPSDFNVEMHMKKAQLIVLELRKDGRPFHTLGPEISHDVLLRAVWLTELHRGEQLSHVPAYNASIVRKYRAKLAEVLPAAFFESPLNVELDRNLAAALPFEDLPGHESFEQLSWDPATAIVGGDEVVARQGRGR